MSSPYDARATRFLEYYSKVMREAVFLPLNLKEASPPACGHKLHVRWRKRAMKWQTIGVETPHASWKYTPFCRPLFCPGKESKYRCNMLNVCPACWARRTAKTWQALDQLFFPCDELRRKQSPVRRCNFDMHWRICRVPENSVRHLCHTVDLRTLSPKGRRGIFRGSGAIGMLDLTSVHIHKSGEPDLPAHAKYRQLFVFPAGTEDVCLPAAKRFPYTCVERPTREEFAGVMGKLFRYPTEIFSMSAPAMQLYLDLVHRRRLLEMFGMLRLSSRDPELFS
jgi:hypothetical protein